MPQNITRETSMGLTASYSAQVKNWWALTVFYNLFNNHFKGPVNNGFLDANVTTHMINITQQFLLGNGWSAEVSGAYRTKALLFAMFFRGPWRANSFGLAKTAFNKKGNFKLSITDPFNLTRNNYNYTKFEGLYTYRMFHEENFKASVTFSYRISNGQKTTAGKKNYKPEENSRVGMPGN